MTFENAKVAKIGKECFLNWNDNKRIFGPQIDENEIRGRAQNRFDPRHMAEASFSWTVRHWNSLTLVIS